MCKRFKSNPCVDLIWTIWTMGNILIWQIVVQTIQIYDIENTAICKPFVSTSCSATILEEAFKLGRQASAAPRSSSITSWTPVYHIPSTLRPVSIHLLNGCGLLLSCRYSWDGRWRLLRMVRLSYSPYHSPNTLSLTLVYRTLDRICPCFLCLQSCLLEINLTSGAFVGALAIGTALHYKDLVATEFYKYPQEWFPSVSATIGMFPASRTLIQGTIIPSGMFSTSLSHFVPDRVLLWFCYGICSVVSESRREYRNSLLLSASSRRFSLECGHM